MTETLTGWRDADREIPKLHTEIFEDFDHEEDYEVSDSVLVFTSEGTCCVGKCCYDECGKPWWFSEDGMDLKVTHWQPLPEKPEKEASWPEE